MRLGEQRNRIFEKYKNIEFMVRELGSIAQNDMEITNEMLELHNEDTHNIISELNNINSELKGMDIDKNKIGEIIETIDDILNEADGGNTELILSVASKNAGRLMELGDVACIGALADISTFVSDIKIRREQLINLKEGR